MWIDKLSKKELSVIEDAKTLARLLREHEQEDIADDVSQLALIIDKMADMLDEEASWNHSFRLLTDEEWVNVENDKSFVKVSLINNKWGNDA